MANNDFYDSKILSKGKLTCDKKILLTIISLAAKEINGVVGLCHSLGGKVKSAIHKSSVPGVKVKFAENGSLIVDVYLIIKSGFSVPDISYRVQENIKSNVAAMVETPVKKINIHIMGVDFVEDKNIN